MCEDKYLLLKGNEAGERTRDPLAVGQFGVEEVLGSLPCIGVPFPLAAGVSAAAAWLEVHIRDHHRAWKQNTCMFHHVSIIRAFTIDSG